MKFLCPSCKAKYQIADAKVAGRSVRMKCRKCGYVIHISKTVTDGSVARKLPAEPEAEAPSAPDSPTASPPPAVVPPVAERSPPRPHVAPPRRSHGASPRAAASPPRAVASPPRAAASPPRPSGATPGPTGPLQATAPPWAAPVQAPAVSAEPDARPHAGSNGAAPPGIVRYDDDEERTVIAGVGALAGAFAEAVRAPESSALPDLVGSEEWYVGINGVPVGPIRLSELRSKAAAGAITEESLVWRDGFEEWMPLKTFPELVAIVDEGVSSARSSLSPLAPSTSPAPGVQLTPMQDPFAAPAAPPPSEVADPFASVPVPAPSAPQTGPAVVTEKDSLGDVDVDAIIPKRRRGSYAPWIAVVVALMFGLTIGFVLFSRQTPAKPIVKYVQVPAKASEKSTDDSQSGKKSNDENVPDQKDTASTKPTKGSSGHASGHASSGKSKKSGGLSGLAGLSSLKGGPKVGPSGGSEHKAAGQPLDSGAVTRTVSRYTGSVKRSCWQPALDTREKNAPSSARVSVTIKVGPSGNVQGVSTSGDPHGYHGLASCIGSRVRGWRFPRSSGTTTVNVPFVFAAQ